MPRECVLLQRWAKLEQARVLGLKEMQPGLGPLRSGKKPSGLWLEEERRGLEDVEESLKAKLGFLEGNSSGLEGGAFGLKGEELRLKGEAFGLEGEASGSASGTLLVSEQLTDVVGLIWNDAVGSTVLAESSDGRAPSLARDVP